MMVKAEQDREKEIVTLAGAVPHSAVNLGVTDNDGNSLYTLVCMKQDVADYIRALKRNGFIAQAFDYDRNAHNQE